MKYKSRALTVTLIIFSIFAALSPSQAQMTWGGYLQTRFSSDFRTSTGFSIRRAKLYTSAVAPFDTNLSARIQAIFRWQTAGTLMLQDAYAEYRVSDLLFRAGQFVPPFSLQRLQPDAAMPVVERALVVDALVPSAETYARDVGAQATLHLQSQWNVTIGAFNGNGGNQSVNSDRELLYIGRSTFQTLLSDSVWIQLGASFAYRNKSAMIFKKIFGTTIPFSGEDARWGGELLLSSSRWSLQSEYIEAHLGADEAYGFYVLGAVYLDRTNELTALVEEYRDLDPKSSDSPWYGAGWNHYFSGNRFKTQFALRAQSSSGTNQYCTTLQLQVYIH